ncbi:NUDIX domain-containing protein [Magnetococcales bacterium HHB-1]
MSEQLHATDKQGVYVKTMERTALLAEIRQQALALGEAPLAVPVVHIILLRRDGRIRLVQRGDKPENPYMWDKAVGGHVVSEKKELTCTIFDENARKEMGEEIGVTDLLIAEDALSYHRLLFTADTHTQAVVKRIDYDPWQGAMSQVRGGEPWLKRHNVMTYMGIYDGPFEFVDGEAQDERSVDQAELMLDVQVEPWKYADGVRVFMQRYAYLMRAIV